MDNFKRSIPFLLIYTRILLGIVILIFSINHVKYYNLITLILFSIGLLTDIFDGIIARQLNISSTRLRRLDSTADQIFFVLITIATFIECPQFFYNHSIKMILLIGIEAVTYIISFIKFRKEVATHAIASKFWTLILFATLMQIILTCRSEILFELCFYVGMLTRLEIIGILFLLPEWTNDVPSIFHAFMLRKGKPIKRHKLFNG